MENEFDLAEILSKFDHEGFSELDVSSALRKIAPDNSLPMDSQLLAEIVAFDFTENYSDEETGWGTYFGPMMVWNNDDGTTTESPSIRKLTPSIIEYWEGRAMESKNPILKARYSGLVWDFKESITNLPPSFTIGEIYVKNLLAIAQKKLHEYEIPTIHKLERALNISLSLNSEELIESCKAAIWEYEKSIAIDTQPGLWGFSFDWLIGNKKIKLAEDIEQEIIIELENRLNRLLSLNKVEADPWATEAVAERLARYYRKQGRATDVKKVITSIGTDFDKKIEGAPSLQACGLLEHLYKIYNEFGLKEEAEKILIRLRELGPKVQNEMETVSHTLVLTEEVQLELDTLVKGEINEVLKRIVLVFLPQKDRAKKQIIDISKHAPFQFLMPQQLMDSKGRVVATLGPIETDLDGHIAKQISDDLYFSAIYLRYALDRIIQKFPFSVDIIIDFIKRTPIVREDRFEIIKRGIEAYLQKDNVIALHLLIPQIEEAIRNLMEDSGIGILKSSRGGGGFHLKTLDELLRDKTLEKMLGEDIVLYLRVLYTDQRGWNLRNDVCHGITSPIAFNEIFSDRVFHSLLLLGLIVKKET